MIKKLLGKLLRPIILKEVKRLMKEFVQPIIELVKTILQREKGTKFLVAIAGIGGLIYLAKLALATTPLIIGIVAVVVGYFLIDFFHKKNGGPTP